MPHSCRQKSPFVGSGPGDMDEMCQRVFGPWTELISNKTGRQIEMIILQHDQCAIGWRSDLLGYRLCKLHIHCYIAIFPVLPDCRINGWFTRNIPHGMLQKP